MDEPLGPITLDALLPLAKRVAQNWNAKKRRPADMREITLAMQALHEYLNPPLWEEEPEQAAAPPPKPAPAPVRPPPVAPIAPHAPPASGEQLAKQLDARQNGGDAVRMVEKFMAEDRATRAHNEMLRASAQQRMQQQREQLMKDLPD